MIVQQGINDGIYGCDSNELGLCSDNRYLSNIDFAENSYGAIVGTLSLPSPDYDLDCSLSPLLACTFAAPTGKFEVSNNQLKLRSGYSADYETQSSYLVTVYFNPSSGGIHQSQNYVLSVIDVNEHPTYINLSNWNITENSYGAIVGTLSVTDPDTDDTHSLSLSGSDSKLFKLSNYPVAAQLKLRSGVSADYETQSSYSVTIYAWDSGGLSYSQDLTVTVNDVNETPTAITLDSTTVAENAVASHIANISGVDPDQDDLSYSITGGSDAASFEIVNGMLHLATGVSADYETQSSYNVILTATDSEGLTYNEAFTISITDVEEASTLYGTSGNDIHLGFAGYEIIDGKEGLDTAKYSVSSDAVSFSVNDSDQLVIEDSLGQSETLDNIERLQFTDKVYALDLDGNAGVAAKAIIATFGADIISAYMSAALSVVDSGTSLESLCDLVVETKLIDQLTGSSSNSSFVGHLFKNVVGRSPNLLENALYTTQLDNGTYTKSSLLALAANTTLTENLVIANSVDLIGVPGSADGEILALQYDLGLG